jgi:fatty-acyl-CoA synthase
VVHPSGDLEIRDRSKDIITSGGENFSSLEVELCFTITPMSVLHQ